jgi:glycosyltransferase involved in cell wall biosynthesis
VNDIRWFAPNEYAALLVPELQSRGISISLDGAAPARLAFSMSGTTALSAWRFAQQHGCPLILYIWDLPPKATGSGSYDPILPIGQYLLRVPRLSGGYARRRGYYSRLRYIASRALQVWVPSSLTGDLVHLRFGVPTQLVPYCYDSRRFSPMVTPKESPPTLLTVGRLQAHKNHAATIRAARRIDRPVQVRLIGRGPEQERLVQLARTLKVTCRIESSVNDAGVVEAYRRASVAVCPSRFEGLGLAPIEAIASGTPVVASAIPPHQEFVGSAARLVSLESEDAWADQIAAALNDRSPDPAAVSHLTIANAGERFFSRLRLLLRSL